MKIGKKRKGRNIMGLLAALWGAAGFLALLGFAIARLSGIALEALSLDLVWTHWAVLVTAVLLMAYFEGFKGFQLSYSPRFASRVTFLRSNVTLLRAVFAPLFCMGFFHAPRRRVIAAVALTVMIIILVTIFQTFAQPWRGLMDAGVAAGLTWGAVITAVLVIRAGISGVPLVDPEVPTARA